MTRTTMRRTISVAVAASALAASFAAGADQIFFTVTGQKQATFKAESTQVAGKTEALEFGYEIVSPRDAASGLATGKRQHKPVRLLKEVGAMSPQLFTALCTNETLPSVVIDFIKINAAGQAQLNYSIRLTNATVTRVSQSVSDPTGTAKGGPTLRETIEFTFQKVEVSSAVSKLSAVDDWQQSGLQ